MPATLTPSRQSLEQERDKLNEKIAADLARERAANRKVLIAEMATLTIPDDGTAKELTEGIAELETQLKIMRHRLNEYNSRRTSTAIMQQTRKSEIVPELLATAPAEIDDALAELETQIATAGTLCRSETIDTKHGARRMSNLASHDTFIRAARVAASQIGALKTTAVDGDEAAEAIAQILKSVPRFDASLREVKQ